jgi:predicted kinase
MDRDMARLHESLLPLAAPQRNGLLVATVGLPGSGKSHIARLLTQRLPLIHMESDALRRTLFRKPAHGYKESRRLFGAINGLIERYLAENRWVLLDATNLREEHRRELKRIADGSASPLVLVETTAPEELILDRLRDRPRGRGEAGVAVYRKLRTEAEPIQLPYHRVETSKDISNAVDEIAGVIERL